MEILVSSFDHHDEIFAQATINQQQGIWPLHEQLNQQWTIIYAQSLKLCTNYHLMFV